MRRGSGDTQLVTESIVAFLEREDEAPEKLLYKTELDFFPRCFKDPSESFQLSLNHHVPSTKVEHCKIEGYLGV